MSGIKEVLFPGGTKTDSQLRNGVVQTIGISLFDQGHRGIAIGATNSRGNTATGEVVVHRDAQTLQALADYFSEMAAQVRNESDTEKPFSHQEFADAWVEQEAERTGPFTGETSDVRCTFTAQSSSFHTFEVQLPNDMARSDIDSMMQSMEDYLSEEDFIQGEAGAFHITHRFGEHN